MSAVPITKGNYLSLDRRLKSSRKPARSQDGYEALLEDMPTEVVTSYGVNEGGVPALKMELKYPFEKGEKRTARGARTPESERASILIGQSSGRIYEVIFQGLKLANTDPEHFTLGVMKCIRDHADGASPSPAQIGVALATADLIKDVFERQLEIVKGEWMRRQRTTQ